MTPSGRAKSTTKPKTTIAKIPRVSAEEWVERIRPYVGLDPNRPYSDSVGKLHEDVPTAAPLTIGDQVSRNTLRQKTLVAGARARAGPA